MAGPITWRNVSSTVSGGAAPSLLGGAQGIINSSFESLNKALERRQQTQSENFDTRQSNLSADYLDRLAQAQSMSELEQLRDSEELAQMRGGMIGTTRDTVRGALDRRQTQIIDRTQETQAHQDDQMGRENRALLGEISEMSLRGKTDEAWQLFNANQDRFVDAQGTAQTLFGDQTKASTERRAQGRYGMEATRHRQSNWRFNNEVEDRDRLEGDRRETETAESLLGDIMQGRLDRTSAFQQTSLQTADRLGIPIVDGEPALGEVTDPEVLREYQAVVGEAAGTLRNDTQLGRDAYQIARQSGLPADAALQLRNDALSQAGALDGLSPKEQSRLQEREQSVVSGYERQRRDLNTEWERTRKGNVFLGETSAVGEQMGSLEEQIQNDQFDPMFFEGMNKDELLNEIRLVSNGIVDNGEVIRVPDAILSNLMSRNVDDWFDPQEGFRDSLTEYVRKNREKYEEAMRATEDHQTKQDALDRQEIQALAAEEGNLRGESGLPRAPASELDQTLQRRIDRLEAQQTQGR